MKRMHSITNDKKEKKIANSFRVTKTKNLEINFRIQFYVLHECTVL